MASLARWRKIGPYPNDKIKKRERLKHRFISQGDVAKMDKAGVCKTPIAGSSPAVASTDVEPIAGRQKEAIGHLLSSLGAVAKRYTLRT